MALGKVVTEAAEAGIRHGVKAIKSAAPDIFSGFTKRVDDAVAENIIAPQIGYTLKRSATESADNIGPMTQMLDGVVEGNPIRKGDLDRFAHAKGFEINQASKFTEEVGESAKISGKAIDPKDLAAKKVERLQGELAALTESAQARLQGVKPTKVQTAKGPQDQLLYPGNKEDLIPEIEQYIRLREQLHEALVKSGVDPKKTKLIQSKAGIAKTFGSAVDEEGWSMRITGGTKGKPAAWQKTKHGSSRQEVARKTPGNLRQEGQKRGWEGLFEGHHQGTSAKEAELFARLNDGSLRSDSDLDYIFGTLEKEGIYMAEHPKNLGALDIPAHRGAKEKPSSLKLGAHPQLRTAYDIEGIGNYMEEASDIQFQIPKSIKGRNRRPIWLTNHQGVFINPNTNKVIGDLADAKKKYGGKGVKAIRFKLYRGGSTYLVGQKHGMTEQLVSLIQRTEDPDDVIALIRLYESLIGPKRRGTAALAHYSMHGADPMGGPGGKVVDPQSRQMYSAAQGDMLEVMEDLRQLPGFNDIPEFRAVAKPFEEITKELRG